MKKTILSVALAAATLGVTGSAMALTFTDGAFNGGVDFSGDITVPVATNQWQWAAGDAVNYNHAVTALTDGYKTLTVVADKNLPLLVGQTKAATIGAPGGVGITPTIKLFQADGTTPVTINFNDSTNSGKGILSLDIVDANTSAKIGTTTMSVKAAGTLAGQQTTAGSILHISSIGNVAADPKNLFAGAIPANPEAFMQSGTASAAWAKTLGATVDSADMISQIAKITGTTKTAYDSDTFNTGRTIDNVSAAFSGSYGLGIAQGDSVVMKFTNPVSANTKWKSSLKATVSYL
ncbi:hypothetical protein HZM62_004129 [Salmonella enterica]|nr:hypothetical protein [Salmonella enterica]